MLVPSQRLPASFVAPARAAAEPCRRGDSSRLHVSCTMHPRPKGERLAARAMRCTSLHVPLVHVVSCELRCLKGS